MLIELNQQPTKIFIVVQGRLEIFRFNDQNEELVAVCGLGMFTGELNVLSGRRGLVSIRASEAGELIEIEREALQTLVQTDSELSDIFLRAYILCFEVGQRRKDSGPYNCDRHSCSISETSTREPI